MTTLRRELRINFEEVIVRNGITSKVGIESDFWQIVVNELADAALEVRGIQKAELPLSIENAIAMDIPVTEEMVQRENLRDLAPKMFERALGFTKPLSWWQGKEWTEFGEWVCERYAESASIFGEYNIWRNTPYTKGGMSNVRIRGFIKEFYDSWDMFVMSRKPKTDEEQPVYKVIPRLEGVPRPANVPPPNIKRGAS